MPHDFEVVPLVSFLNHAAAPNCHYLEEAAGTRMYETKKQAAFKTMEKKAAGPRPTTGQRRPHARAAAADDDRRRVLNAASRRAAQNLRGAHRAQRRLARLVEHLRLVALALPRLLAQQDPQRGVAACTWLAVSMLTLVVTGDCRRDSRS